MSDTVISVRNLGKKYRLGATLSPDTLRDHVMQVVGRLRKRNEPREKPSRDFWALKDVSFDVTQGEVLGVIGPNGAGKSTLLKILTRITEPTEGEVRIKGRVASLLEVGTGFHPELSGRENIFMNGAILGMTQREIRVKFDEIVDFAGIEQFLDTPVKRYSNGMRVRLGFAVAAHLEPEILLVDEVLAVGDAAFQQKCLGKMRDVAGHGRTVLFVSHDLFAIGSLSTRCCLLRSGEIETIGVTDSVIDCYRRLVRRQVDAPLSERSDRTGNGRLRIVGFQAVDEGCPHGLRCSEPATFVVALHASNPKATEQARVAIQLVTEAGMIIGAYFSGFFGQSFNVSASITSVICKIPEMPLAPGHYYVHLWAGTQDGKADYLEYASRIEVLNGPCCPFLKLPDPQAHGCFILPHEWSVR